MLTCFDIGGSSIKSALAYTATDIRPAQRGPTPLDDFEAFTNVIQNFIHPDSDLQGPIAIGITGVVDADSGAIKCANIPCIDGRDLASDLSARLGRTVLVANDADCFALAEAGAGAGVGHRIVFGAILGTGVGGGMVVDGHLLPANGGFSGEWGHGPIVATSAGNPPIAIPHFSCGCGQQGCADTVGGARGMERLHTFLTGHTLPSTEIVATWRAGDQGAKQTIECMVDLLANPLALVVNITGASVVPVGGGLGHLTDFITMLDIAVRRRILRDTKLALVVPGACQGTPGLIGAGILGLNHVAQLARKIQSD